jgi:hypothetical protein
MSFYMDNGRRIWVPHRRVEHGDDEYAIRNEQVRLRSDEACR